MYVLTYYPGCMYLSVSRGNFYSMNKERLREPGYIQNM